MSKFCKPMGLYVTYLDCLECEDKECMRRKENVQKRYLNVDIGSMVYLVFSAKKLGNENNIVVKCEVEKAIVYKDSTVYCCNMIKIVTKHKEENIKNWVTSFMFENANIDTGYKGGVPNRYPVFTTKEKCIEWLQE